MSTYNLDAFFAPRSIAVIGASRRDRAVGKVVAENLFSGGFDGPIMPVNPHETAIRGVLAYKDVASLPAAPDLAVIATPASTVSDLIGALGKRGCRVAVVLTAGFETDDVVSRDQREAIRAAAREHGLRIIGPNCLGIMAPHSGINASFAHVPPLKGRIACVMQSGALAAAVLDWASARGVGFSKLVSLGDAIDVDFGDMLNYLASDPETDSILLYVEGLTHARKFMAAARAIARAKPIVVLKAGRNPAAAAAVRSHTGALAGSDRIYDAAFSRAGIIRVDALEALFEAAETLVHRRPLKGGRLAIVTNGGGAGVLAADALFARQGTLATLEPRTIAALNATLPPCWSQGNPVDIIGDATGLRYAAALKAVAADPGVDALLIMNCPTAVASSLEAAQAVVAAMAEGTGAACGKPVLACWLGDHSAEPACEVLLAAGISTFATPEAAIEGFTYLTEFERGAAQLRESGADELLEPKPERDKADGLLRGALERGQEWLDELDAKALLAAYGIPVARTVKAANPEEVATIAEQIGGRVAVKIRSPDITHKSDVGGVALDLDSPWRARAAAQAMLDHIRIVKPDARIEGLVVEEMVRRPGSFELIAGIATDDTFGPVVLFGRGGIAVTEIDDTAVGLPPLTPALAADLVSRTRVSRLLSGYRNRPPANLEAIQDVLVRLSRLVADHPEVRELDINPLLADAHSVVVLDARVRLQDPALAVQVALKSYPHELERRVATGDGGEMVIRPIRAEDAPALQRFIEGLDAATIRASFFETMKRLPPALVDRLTQIDYDRDMAFVALDKAADPDEDVICGVGRMVILPGGAKGDYALTVSPAMISRGVARALMDELVAYARGRGLERLCGAELMDSAGLLGVARDLGGAVTQDAGDPTIACIALKLQPHDRAAA